MVLWTQPSQRLFRFDVFEVDLWTGELRKDGTKLKVQDQPFKILAMLLVRPGELVTREELREGLWSDDTFVDFDRGLNTAVNRLRFALNDSAETPRFVETVGSRGYRFIAPVATKGSGKTETASQPSTSSSRLYEWSSVSQETLSSQPIAQPQGPTVRQGRYLSAAIIAMILLAVGGIGYAMYRSRSRGPRPNLENIQITKLTDSGKAEDVAISPDGRYVVYLFRDGEDTSLRLRQVGARGEAQVLVHEALLFPGLAFSPDGNNLYFLRATPKDQLYRDLYEIPLLGGAERKVSSNVDTAIHFSPDGQRFVYESGMPRLDSVEIRVANADGSDDHLLANLQGAWAGYTPGAAWSPDGRSIVVPLWMHHKQPSYVLDIISTASGGVRELYSGNQALGRPRWVRDGNTLVVPINNENGRTQLWTVSYVRGEIRRLTNDLANYDLGIDTTRDGRTLATIQWTTIANLWASSSLDGSNGKQVTSGEQQVDDLFPLDGGKVGLINRSDNGLWIMNADGTHPRFAADASGASWFTGCRRFVLFESDRSGTNQLMRVDEEGANAKSLATGTMWGQTCSPDGRFIYYAEALKPRWKVRRVPIDGGTPVDIVENPGESIPGRVTISPDGQLLAFPYDVASSEPALKIGVIPIAGGPLVKLFDVAGDINGPRWSPDGRGLQYLLDKNGATNLWEQPLSGGPPRQLTKFASGRIFDFNWTDDGKQLLLSRGEVTSDVVLLSNLR